MTEFVRVETEDAVATIRLDRPPMNALNTAVQEQIAAAAARLTADEDIRAGVIYGGEKVFAAGADIKEMAEASYGQMAADTRRLQDAFTAVATIPKPVVAAITGYALGGGLELALCADFRVMGESARVGQPEILLGISGCPASSGRPGPRTSCSPAGSSAPRRRWPLAWSTRSSPTPRCMTPRGRSWPGTPAVRRWRCVPPSRPSTAASTWTCPPGWRLSG
jgi:hypothetical protein